MFNCREISWTMDLSCCSTSASMRQHAWKQLPSLDTVSRGSGIMLPGEWILKRDGGLDRGVLDYYS